MTSRIALVALFSAVASACGGSPKPAAPPPPPPTAPPPVAVAPAAPAKAANSELDRDTFNRMAVRLDLPLYWAADTNKNGGVDADEVRTLMFYPPAGPWVKDGKLTPEFDTAYAALVAQSKAAPPADAREKLVIEELDQGKPTLVYSDLSGLSAADKAFVGHILKATRGIDVLYAEQTGKLALQSQVPKDDIASLSLMRRNWGPKCRAPKTENDAACSAIAGAPKPAVDVYPADLQKDDKFCEALEKRRDSKKLLTPFTVVRQEGKKLVAQPYLKAYERRMAAVATELDAAAAALTDPAESALKGYVEAAAKSFRSNDWGPADEAWSKLNAKNSKWYLRVAPDEVYWEPCSHKAGFHLTFARINQASLSWQDKLTPHQQEMEAALAKLIGKPYKPRKVTFHLPDFIDIVVNAGDDRQPFGATIGQSLPNWGKVASEGRGRTVAMSNLFNDPDSRAIRRQEAESLLDKAAMALYTDDATPGLLDTILHEATHNLGPAHEYKYRGKTAEQAFGGGLASMFEELKAQTGALYFLDFVQKLGIISPELQKQTYVDSVVWAFGHISRGMYTPTKQRRPYSQLAAVQIGFLMDEGALRWDPAATAANGTDKGAFVVDTAKFPAAVEKLMRTVATIKATNDKAGAEALAKKYVDGAVVPHQAIVDRFLRFPKTSLVYAVDL